ncbi:hypothetical protein AB0J72_40200 [Dactylosporangium sp. NPDC049742]|uniref:hypothetical protein n=1 Tax=Dactylosporangium sp. NPDC049742 TaxID=3154737 RepID=UPI00343D205E
MLRRSLAALATAALLGAVLVAPQPATAAEYVSNGTFSGGTASWNMPTGGGAAGTETCCADPPGGVPNAFFHPNGQGSGTSLNAYLASWQNIAGAPSGTYTLSAKVRGSGGVQQSFVQADNGLFDSTYCRSAPTNTGSWITVSCSFAYTAGSTLHVAIATSNLPATNGGWVAFDDVSLTGGGGENPPYDLATYVIRADGADSTPHHMNTGENNQLQYSGGRYYQVKNAHWEELWATSTAIYRFRDTSDPNTYYGLYTSGGAQGDLWIGRYVSPGYSLVRSPSIRVYNKSNCGAAPGWGTDPSRIVFMQYFASWTSPSGVTLSNVIWLQSQHTFNGVYNRWEDYYYAKGLGLVAFYGYDYQLPGSGPTFQGWIDSTSAATPVRESVCTP